MVTNSLFRTSEKCSTHLFLYCPRIPSCVLDNAYICIGVSAELFGQSIDCAHFPSLYSSFHFPCNIVHMISLNCRAERLS